MKNFRIVENAPPNYLEKYDEFVKLYNDISINTFEIQKRLGWNVKQFSLARNRALEEGLIKERRIKKTNHKVKKKSKRGRHYSRDIYGKYKVMKYIDGVYNYYGIYDDESTAIRMVEELKKVNWDKSQLEEIKSKVKSE